MVDSIRDVIRQPDFREYHQIFLDNAYYEFLFPFLLVVALLYTVLASTRANIFRTGSDSFNRSAAMVVSIVIAYYGVSFETSPGMNVGKMLMLLFPNISAFTIGVLALYIVGAILGKDFFKGLFGTSGSAYGYFAVGAIGLGSVVFYVGIAIGLWDVDPFDGSAFWNVVLGVTLLILGVTLIVIEYAGFGILLLVVLGTFVADNHDSLEGASFLDYIFDPVVFIAFIVILLFTWLNPSDPEWKKRARYENARDELSLENYRRLYGGREPGPYRSRTHDLTKDSYESRKKKYREYYPDDEF